MLINKKTELMFICLVFFFLFFFADPKNDPIRDSDPRNDPNREFFDPLQPYCDGMEVR